MATYTPNYNLEKPAQTDIYNIDVFNANADKVDAALGEKADQTMLAPVESSNVASQNYAVGDYFVYNGYLCRATSAISMGSTIAIGTNCASTAAGTELKSIKDALTSYNYASYTTLSSGEIAAGASKTVTISGNGLISLIDLYTMETITTGPSGRPYVRLVINGNDVFRTQGFFLAGVRTSGCVVPVKTGDVVVIYIANMKLTNHQLLFFAKS